MTKEEWEKAREVIKSKSQAQFRTENNMPLQKKLRCGNCRRTLAKNMNVPSPFTYEMAQAFIDNVYVYNKKKIDICFKFQDELDKYKDALMADAVTEVVNA